MAWLYVKLRDAMRNHIPDGYKPEKAVKWLLRIFTALLVVNFVALLFSDDIAFYIDENKEFSEGYYNSGVLSAGIGCYVLIFAILSFCIAWLLPSPWKKNLKEEARHKVSQISKWGIVGLIAGAMVVCFVVSALIISNYTETHMTPPHGTAFYDRNDAL